MWYCAYWCSLIWSIFALCSWCLWSISLLLTNILQLRHIKLYLGGSIFVIIIMQFFAIGIVWLPTHYNFSSSTNTMVSRGCPYLGDSWGIIFCSKVCAYCNMNFLLVLIFWWYKLWRYLLVLVLISLCLGFLYFSYFSHAL